MLDESETTYRGWVGIQEVWEGGNGVEGMGEWHLYVYIYLYSFDF